MNPDIGSGSIWIYIYLNIYIIQGSGSRKNLAESGPAPTTHFDLQIGYYKRRAFPLIFLLFLINLRNKTPKMNVLLLPVEVHLDIFKYLNFNQISSIQQTNSYFCSLIDKYIGILAKKKFYSFETIVYKSVNDKNKYLKLNEEDIGLDDGFELSSQLRKQVRNFLEGRVLD